MAHDHRWAPFQLEPAAAAGWLLDSVCVVAGCGLCQTRLITDAEAATLRDAAPGPPPAPRWGQIAADLLASHGPAWREADLATLDGLTAELVVAACNSYPALVAELERVQTENTRYAGTLSGEALALAEQLAADVTRLRALIAVLPQRHWHAEDCSYRMQPDGTGGVRSTDCICGASARNARIDALLAEGTLLR